MDHIQARHSEGRMALRRLVIFTLAAAVFVEIFGLPHVRLWDGAYWSVTGRNSASMGERGGNRPPVLLIDLQPSLLDRAGIAAQQAWSSATARINL